MSEDFKIAVEKVNSLKKKPSDKELLEIYGLYKRVTEGKNTKPRPGLLDIKGRSKWDSWDNVSRKYSRQKAVELYIDLANKLSNSYS